MGDFAKNDLKIKFLGSSYLEQSNMPTKVSQALEFKLDDYIKELKK